MSDVQPRVLLVDLNNYARYPTLAIGYLVAALRADGVQVQVLCPLAHGVAAVEREHQERPLDQLQRRVFFSGNAVLQHAHETLRSVRNRTINRPNAVVLEQVSTALEVGDIDVVLLSAYLEHYPTVCAIGELTAKHGRPLVVGGPMFNVPEVSRQWLGVPGLTAIIGAEVDLTLPQIVRAVVAGDDLAGVPGAFLPDGRQGPSALSLPELARLPVPDFSDFPWGSFHDKVIPLLAGRGCNWSRCRFCSDIITANGRGFRTRPVPAALEEMKVQSERHDTRDFIFLDLKLNSDLTMWDGIIDSVQDVVPGARWVGTVHVQRGENGLTAARLKDAAASGMVRTTFGLETGSQRLNDSMAKGTTVEAMSQFIHDAYDAGISVRTTMMLGYPGERADDVRRTAAFLRAHQRYLDRVRIGRFKAIPGTLFEQHYSRRPERFADLRKVVWHNRYARASYVSAVAHEPEYRAAKRQVLQLVHEINRKPLRPGAESFDGLM